MTTVNITEFDETQQAIVDNIATQAFLRGKIDALRSLEDHFNVFSARQILKEDLIKAIQSAILVLQEGLK